MSMRIKSLQVRLSVVRMCARHVEERAAGKEKPFKDLQGDVVNPD